MKIVEIHSGNFGTYERFLKAHGGGLDQSWEWGEFQKQIPTRGKFWVFAVEGGGNWLGTALVVGQRLPFGLCWLSIARGPVLSKDVNAEMTWEKLLERIRLLAKQEKAVFIRAELPINSPLQLQGRGWHKAHAHYQPEWTLEVDLMSSEEEILAQMKQKGRYNIKVARKHDVTIRMSTDPKDVSAFYKILQATSKRDGFGIHPESYYQTLAEAMENGKWGTIFIAEHEGKMISGLFVTFYGDTARYYYGASAHEHRPLMAPYLLQWEAMKEAKKRGFKWYDFFGIAPPDQPGHPWTGITQFKERFGGIKIEYPKAKELVFKSFWYWVLRLRKGFRTL